MSLFWTLLVIILAFFAGFAVFVKVRFGSSPLAAYGAAPAAQPETPAAPAEPPQAAEPAPEAAPQEAAATGSQGPVPPADGAPDDLKLISGVGPKLEEKLNGIGITQFRQIAALTPAQASWVDDQLASNGRLARDDWIGQAKTLSQGG